MLSLIGAHVVRALLPRSMLAILTLASAHGIDLPWHGNRASSGFVRAHVRVPHPCFLMALSKVQCGHLFPGSERVRNPLPRPACTSSQAPGCSIHHQFVTLLCSSLIHVCRLGPWMKIAGIGIRKPRLIQGAPHRAVPWGSLLPQAPRSYAKALHLKLQYCRGVVRSSLLVV